MPSTHSLNQPQHRDCLAYLRLFNVKAFCAPHQSTNALLKIKIWIFLFTINVSKPNKFHINNLNLDRPFNCPSSIEVSRDKHSAEFNHVSTIFHWKACTAQIFISLRDNFMPKLFLRISANCAIPKKIGETSPVPRVGGPP